jgi:hypothetical protein
MGTRPRPRQAAGLDIERCPVQFQRLLVLALYLVDNGDVPEIARRTAHSPQVAQQTRLAPRLASTTRGPTDSPMCRARRRKSRNISGRRGQSTGGR